MTEESLFTAILERSNAAERRAFLDEVCGADEGLRRRMQQLLAAHEQMTGILDDVPDLDCTFTSAPPSTVAGGSLVADRYRVLECIGEGGMGTVWAAEQLEPVRRKVALKLLKPGLETGQVLARFDAERQALALMDHPHIAKVFDGGLARGFIPGADYPFFAMEFVQGVPLTQFCDEARLTVPERLRLFLLICQAVQHAHQKGIVHRDLKPSNLLVSVVDNQPVPKVIDFGLAKALHAPLTDHTLHTAPGLMMGTPLYMSPEQARINNLDIDTRTDIYSLGVILYELLTGSTPLERKRLKDADWPALLHAITTEEPQMPSSRLSGSDLLPKVAAQRQLEPVKLCRFLQGDLDWIVMKCLEKDRARRYETASALARDIERYLHDEPVEAGPPSATYRMKKFLRRHRGPVVAAAAMAVLLLGGIIGTTWQAVQAEEARDQAEAARDAQAKRADGEATARRQAEEARRRMQEEMEIAQALRNFLAWDILCPFGPLVQDEALERAQFDSDKPENPMLRDLVDRAAAGVAPGRIEARFPGQPLVQAEVLHVIGFVYRRIGEDRKAIDHLERAHDLYMATRGFLHHDTLSSLNLLGILYKDTQRWPDAVRVLQLAHDGSRQLYGLDHPFTCFNLHLLAKAYYGAKDLPEATRLLQDLYRRRERSKGAEALETLLTLDSLATVLEASGNLPEALQIYERLREVRIRINGADHPDTLVTLTSFAAACQKARRWVHAIQLYEEFRDHYGTRFPADHPFVLGKLLELGSAYQQVGRTKDAVRLLEKVGQGHVRKFGPEDRATLVAFGALAVAYRHAGQLPDALRIWRDIVPKARRTLGPSDPTTMGLLNAWALGLEDDRQFDQVITLARELVAFERERRPPSPVNLARQLELLGRALLRAGQPAEAEPHLRENLAIREANARQSWMTFRARSLVGDALLGLGKYQEAEPLLITGYLGMKQRHEAILERVRQQYLLEAVEPLVRLCEATGRSDEAAKWRHEMAKYKTDTPASP